MLHCATSQTLYQNMGMTVFFVSSLNTSYAFRGAASHRDQMPSIIDVDDESQQNYPLSFFRCRKEKEIKSREELLHVPLTKRSLSSSNRFSLPGIPCLYLASTTFCCWNELGQPNEMTAAAFRLNEKGEDLKILNLVISQRLIDGMDYDPFKPMPPLAFKMRVFFPLIIATSISTLQQDTTGYKPEYTISHLIMRSLKKLGIDGVAYLSARIDDEFQYPHGVNLAIPIFSDSTKQVYGDVSQCFEMTNSICFPCSERLSSEKPAHKSYINTIYKDGFSSTIDYFGTRMQYKETPFSFLDDELFGSSFYPAFDNSPDQ